MMMIPAARSKSRLSGILAIEFAGSAIFSRAPLWPHEATTRSPGLRSVTPAPTLSITPATSAAGENGNGGLIWYLPWIIRRSKKFSAADLMAITAWPASATGSGTSVSTRSSGPQYCEQRTAFMDTPRCSKRIGNALACFMPDLEPPDNLIRGCAALSKARRGGLVSVCRLGVTQLPSQTGISRLSIGYVTRDVGPSSSHNDEGTRFGHVRAANADSSGGECAGVRDRDPGAGAEPVAEIRRQV